MDPLKPYTSLYVTKLGIRQWSYPKASSHGSQLYSVVKPFLLLMRLLGRFPYTIDVNGTTQTKLCSGWSMYTAVVGGLQWTAIIFMYRQPHKASEDSAFSGINSVITAVQGLTAVTVWFEGRWLSGHLNKWLQFQDELNSCKVTLDNRLHKRTLLFLVLLLPIIAAFAFFQSLQTGSMVAFPVYTLLQTSSFLVVSLWLFVVLFIRLTSTCILHLSADLGGVLFLSLVQMMFACCVVWITVCYSFIFTVRYTVSSDEDYTASRALVAGHVFLFTICAVILIIICEGSNRCTTSLGPTFLKEILKINFYLQNKETQRELYRFAEAIRLKYPDVTVGSYFVVDRKLLISLLSAAVTYLVVLVQFKIAADS